MAIRWIEGFEIDGGAGYLSTKYQNRPSPTVSGPGRIFGKYAQGGTLVTPVLASSPLAGWIIGMGWFAGTNPNPATDFISYYNGGLRQLSLHFLSTRKWEVRRGATVLASGTTAVPNLDWHYVEFEATIHTSAGAFEVRIDGVTEVSASGVNTAAAGINDADTVVFRSNSNNRFDDIYILDTVGGQETTFLGPRTVEGLLPTGDGDTQEWTPSAAADHYTLVDDVATAPNLTDYVFSPDVGDDELFSLSNLKFITGDINAVAVNMLMGLQGVASRTIRAKYRSASDAEGNGPTVPVSSTGAQNKQAVMEQDPSGTPDRWTLEDINTGQFGVEVVS